jgi:hypothetical protein
VLSPFSTAKNPTTSVLDDEDDMQDNEVLFYNRFYFMNPFFACQSIDEKIEFRYFFKNIDGNLYEFLSKNT